MKVSPRAWSCACQLRSGSGVNSHRVAVGAAGRLWARGGVGGSIGIDRLLAAIEEREGEAVPGASSHVLVVHPGDERLDLAFAFAAALRARGLAAEVYPEAKKHGAQMRYADRSGIRFVFTPDADGSWHAKDLARGETFTAATADEAAAAVEARRGDVGG